MRSLAAQASAASQLGSILPLVGHAHLPISALLPPVSPVCDFLFFSPHSHCQAVQPPPNPNLHSPPPPPRLPFLHYSWEHTRPLLCLTSFWSLRLLSLCPLCCCLSAVVALTPESPFTTTLASEPHAFQPPRIPHTPSSISPLPPWQRSDSLIYGAKPTYLRILGRPQHSSILAFLDALVATPCCRAISSRSGTKHLPAA